jgi:hypothetical protein
VQAPPTCRLDRCQVALSSAHSRRSPDLETFRNWRRPVSDIHIVWRQLKAGIPQLPRTVHGRFESQAPCDSHLEKFRFLLNTRSRIIARSHWLRPAVSGFRFKSWAHLSTELAKLAAGRERAEQPLARFGVVPGKYRADKFSESRAKHLFERQEARQCLNHQIENRITPPWSSLCDDCGHALTKQATRPPCHQMGRILPECGWQRGPIPTVR